MKYVAILGLFMILVACKSDKKTEGVAKSVHPYANYFYPYDSVPRIYCYRNVANGLDEEFHRIYGVKDKLGHHIVVERYAQDGRILEALNYNYDSLDIIDHMVVDRNKHKNSVPLLKRTLIPWDEKNESWFWTEYPSQFDSTIIIETTKRKFSKRINDFTVLENEKRKSIAFSYTTKRTLMNIITKKPSKPLETIGELIFSEGFGLVEFTTNYSGKLIEHFKLEKVITQKEWVQFIRR